MSHRPATVLAYHAIGDCPPSDDPHHLWVPTSAFEAQMAFLSRARRVVPLHVLVAGGSESAGKPMVAITFDDAYRSVLTHAAPVLARYGLPATVFTPSAYIGDRNRWDPPAGAALEIMDEAELRAADAAGIAVESHGHQHLDLSDASEDEARADLGPSIERLAAVVGRRPRLLAFPFRTGSPGARRAAAQIGFDAAFTIDLPHDGRYGWGRVGVAPGDSLAFFRLKTAGRYLELRHHSALDGGYRLARRLVPRRRAN